MARYSTLESILAGARVEARVSPNPAHNIQTRDMHVALIQREQARLWEDFAWPHLRVERFIPLAAGQRFYDVNSAVKEDGTTPEQVVPIDRIERIDVKSNIIWLPLQEGISTGEYAIFDSMRDQRSWPPVRFRLYEDEQIEVWPIPSIDAATDGTHESWLKITGIRALQPFVDDSDRADLDDRLLELYTAGAILAAAGAKDAQFKLEAANRHYARLKASLTKAERFQLFNVGERKPPMRRSYITHYRPPVV